MRVIHRTLLLIACLVLLPALAHAQATLAGTVRDTSGAVLPGVTVATSSPALIEKVRTAVTDGTVQETIRVTGESPLVDTQSTRREMVVNAETIKTLPMTRSYDGVLYTVPGLSVAPGVGGSDLMPSMSVFTAHGGNSTEGRMMVNGVPVAGSFSGNSVAQFGYDLARDTCGRR